jgi:hypothetical protein
MTTLQVTVSSVNTSIPGKVRIVLDGSLSVEEAKKMILEHLRLAKTLSINQIMLLFRSEFNPHLKYASLPYPGTRQDWLLVLDETRLGSFLQGLTTIQFMLYQD